MTLSILQDGSVQKQRRNGMVMFTIRSSADGNVHKVVRGVESSTLSREMSTKLDRRRMSSSLSPFSLRRRRYCDANDTRDRPARRCQRRMAINPSDTRPISLTEAREEVTFVVAAPGAANGIADGRVTHTARRQWWTRQWAALWDLQWSIKPLSSIYDHQRCAARVTLSLFHCNDALWRQLQC